MDPSKPISAEETFSNENYIDENHNTEFKGTTTHFFKEFRSVKKT